MNRTRLSMSLAVAVLGLALAVPGRPAIADGAASTRNIILGGAAATAGTLIWLNHNKKVHQKYAEYDARQAATEQQANQAEAAYESERAAYVHETAMVAAYQKTIAYQHAQVVARDRRISQLTRSLTVAKASANRPPAGTVAAAPAVLADRRELTRRSVVAPNTATYGWGIF